jgi:hypothetical protein
VNTSESSTSPGKQIFIYPVLSTAVSKLLSVAALRSR